MTECECPTFWHGIVPPPCPVHNPPAPTYRARADCPTCGAVVSDQEKHRQWHDGQALVARDASLGAMSMRPIGGPRR